MRAPLDFHLYIETRGQVSEFWYEQKLFEDKLRIKIGKIDATNEFGHASNGEEFLTGVSRDWPSIMGFPTGSRPCGRKAVAFFTPTEHFYFGAGLFDGTGFTGYTGDRGLGDLNANSLFTIGEAGREMGPAINLMAESAWESGTTSAKCPGSPARRKRLHGKPCVSDQQL